MLTKERGRKLSNYVSDYCLFDLETTGISPYKDEVIEISAVKVISGKIVDEFSTLVNPRRAIPYQASLVNNITDDMVVNAPFFEEALKNFLEFAGELVLVGHNIGSFDMKFLYRDAEKFWGKVPNNDYIDTLPFARKILPKLSHHRLTDLAAYYGISTDGAHRALNDCKMNQQVFERLAKDMDNPTIEEGEKCPKCGMPLKQRNGIYGAFYGCTGFPNCRYTKNI